MSEVLLEAVAYANLPFTVLLGLVILYWLLVAVGAMESNFGGSEIDAHVDTHADQHLDVHGDHGLHAPHKELSHGEDAAHGHAGDSGWLSGVAQFVNLGEVPLMVVLSIISLSLWVGALLANHYLTGHHPLFALALVVPNLIVAIVVTHYVTIPLRPLFRLLRREGEEEIKIVGQPCRITSRAGDSTGQAEVEIPGVPLLVNVRTLDGQSLAKGQTAIIVRADEERGLYFVVPYSPLSTVASNGEAPR